MQYTRIKDFSKGMNTFYSPYDLPEGFFQKFENINNLKLGRVEKVKGLLSVSATQNIDLTKVPQGQGFFMYRTDRNAAGALTPTLWWLIYYYATTNDWRMKRKEAVTGGSWEAVEIMDHVAAGNWTDVSGVAEIDMYAINGVLRISDGELGHTANNGNPSQWYGFIERDVFGNGVTYSDVAFPNYVQPPMKEAISEWYRDEQELKPPIVFKMTGAHDLGGNVDSAREVGIFVYDARHEYGTTPITADDHRYWPDAEEDDTFHWNDRWAVTFVYDNNQESELSRDANGNIGVGGFEVIKSTDAVDSGTDVDGAIAEGDYNITVDEISHFTNGDIILIDGEQMRILYKDAETGNAFMWVERGYNNTIQSSHNDDVDVYFAGNPQKARAINIVPYTGASLASWNHRITAIRLYWQPNGEVDWYFVDHYDIERGNSDSSLAVFDPQNPDSSVFNITDVGNNWGAWTACPTNAVRTADNDFAVLENTSTGTEWEMAGYFDLVQAGDIAMAANMEAGSFASESAGIETLFNMLKTVRGVVATVPDTNSITFTANDAICNRIGYRATSEPDLYTGDAAVFAPLTTKLTNWYTPFDGYRVATYQGSTGRTETDRIRAVKWKTSCVGDDGTVFIGNTDTLDENNQTVREQSRVMWSKPNEPDEFINIFGRSREFGRHDGDEIISLEYWNGRVYVFKNRNTYVYNVSSSQYYLESHYPGYGCRYRHASVVTPFGVVVADKARINLYSTDRPKELSYVWREDYQGLTFSRPVMGFSPETNELYFVNDTSEDDLVLYKYNFDLGSWSKETMPDAYTLSNLCIGKDMEVQGAFHYNTTQDVVVIKEFNDTDTPTDNTDTVVIKTGMIDAGDPWRRKSLRRIRCIYKTDDEGADAMTVRTYVDGVSSPTASYTFAAKASLGALTLSKNTTPTLTNHAFKTIEIQFECAGQDFVLDEVVLEWTMMGEKD